MTEDERRDLLELKAFLERSIEDVDNDLIFTDRSVSARDYDFMIEKIRMYRKSLVQIIELLK